MVRFTLAPSRRSVSGDASATLNFIWTRGFGLPSCQVCYTLARWKTLFNIIIRAKVRSESKVMQNGKVISNYTNLR